MLEAEQDHLLQLIVSLHGQAWAARKSSRSFCFQSELLFVNYVLDCYIRYVQAPPGGQRTLLDGASSTSRS